MSLINSRYWYVCFNPIETKEEGQIEKRSNFNENLYYDLMVY